jgi:hypothetical protein
MASSVHALMTPEHEILLGGARALKNAQRSKFSNRPPKPFSRPSMIEPSDYRLVRHALKLIADRWRAYGMGRSSWPRQPQNEEAADEGAKTDGADSEPEARFEHADSLPFPARFWVGPTPGG